MRIPVHRRVFSQYESVREKGPTGISSSRSDLDTRLKTELAPAPFIQSEIGDQIEEPGGRRRESSPCTPRAKSNVPQDDTFITQNKSPLHKCHMHNQAIGIIIIVISFSMGRPMQIVIDTQQKKTKKNGLYINVASEIQRGDTQQHNNKPQDTEATKGFRACVAENMPPPRIHNPSYTYENIKASCVILYRESTDTENKYLLLVCTAVSH